MDVEGVTYMQYINTDPTVTLICSNRDRHIAIKRLYYFQSESYLWVLSREHMTFELKARISLHKLMYY